MSKDYSFAQDLREAQSFVDGLENYVQGDELYGSVGGGFFTNRQMPALTAGSLAMRVRRLTALDSQLTAEQRQQLDIIRRKQDDIRKRWYAHYKAKLEREVKSRLDAMQPYFEEARTDPKLAVRVYGPEVLRRTIAEEAIIALADLGEDVAEFTRKAKTTDSQLRRYVKAGEFAWNTLLEEAYPRERFWWMYSAPPTQEE